MNTFVNAVINQETRTTNGMRARVETANKNVDLFFKIGASRGQNIIPSFVGAYVEDAEIALRIAQWARDVRGGAGEREIFRQILKYLAQNYPQDAIRLLHKVPEVGRWDDLLVFESGDVRNVAFDLIKNALDAGHGLCAKWMPRKGEKAVELRSYFGWTPKFYRKRLVELTKVVETQMCANDWENINFSHVPSIAAARYKKAFNRHTPKYAEYVDSLVKGEKNVKVNASAIFPHDVLKGRIGAFGFNQTYDKVEKDLIQKQWEALPNYVGNANILPLVDVSGSMICSVGGNKNLTCLDVSVSLGLYLAEKNKGKFKDTFLTFSGSPELMHLTGNIHEKIDQMIRSKWSMNTDIVAAFKKILNVAVAGKVPQSEMPEMLLILSDMQFDSCTQHDDSAIEMIRRKYEANGYNAPRVVFWNLHAHDNVPVKFNESGTALVSGFSPSILTSLLKGNLDNFTPEYIMMETVMKDRYSL
jgi:hypothetical protein